MRRRLAPLVGLILITAAGGSCGAPQQQQPSLNTTVRDFVRATYPHGVPYDQALALGPAAEPILQQLFDDPAMVDHRSNTIVTLGILGSAARVIAAIEAGTGNLTAAEVNVRMDAVMALGYTAYAAGPGSPPLLYLIGGLDAAAWGPRVKWRLPSGADPAGMLRSRSIGASGLSGKPEALKALQSLPAGGGGGRGGGTSSEQSRIDEAIAANQFIAASGMSKYYATFLR